MDYLEERQMLTVLASVTGGTLDITFSNTSDTAELGVDGSGAFTVSDHNSALVATFGPSSAVTDIVVTGSTGQTDDVAFSASLPSIFGAGNSLLTSFTATANIDSVAFDGFNITTSGNQSYAMSSAVAVMAIGTSDLTSTSPTGIISLALSRALPSRKPGY